MAVILVLCTFLVFIVIDVVLSRKRARVPVTVQRGAESKVGEESYIEGFLVPDRLRYHTGHGWLLRERKNVMRIGIDEFAAALLGRVEKIELPKPGHWIRQGQRSLAFLRGEEKAEMVSPIEGEVVEVNSEIISDPSLLRKDPYGKGWLMTVFAPDEESTFRNLLPANLVGSWMREAVGRLYAMQPNLAGAVAADGGRPAEDLSVAFPNKRWSELTGEFFLTR
jgi:glycine cleavage system H lipoate-binding protein